MNLPSRHLHWNHAEYLFTASMERKNLQSNHKMDIWAHEYCIRIDCICNNHILSKAGCRGGRARGTLVWLAILWNRSSQRVKDFPPDITVRYISNLYTCVCSTYGVYQQSLQYCNKSIYSLTTKLADMCLQVIPANKNY